VAATGRPSSREAKHAFRDELFFGDTVVLDLQPEPFGRMCRANHSALAFAAS